MRPEYDERYHRGRPGGAREVVAEYAPRYPGVVAASAAPSERAWFIQRTYSHLAFAILAFIALEALLLWVVPREQVFALYARSNWSLLVVVGAFLVVSYVAQTWSRSESSRALQYAGLGLYVVAEAFIILPLLFVCYYQFGPGEGNAIVSSAGIFTLAVFGGLTLTAFVTRKDFSFLYPIVFVGTFLALGLIVVALLFHFTLGLLFSFAIVVLMAGSILAQTSEILHRHRTDQYVAAALGLFASIATMFYYILKILIILNSNNRD
jgi:FtsH-binding integral membrane protein